MKKSKHYAVIASHKRSALLAYSILGLVLAAACVSSIPTAFQVYNLEDSYLTAVAAVIFTLVGLFVFVYFLRRTIDNMLIAADDKHLYLKKRSIPWSKIKQFLFSEEEINGKSVYFVTVAFKLVPVNSSFTFSRDKQPTGVGGGTIATPNPKKDTVYRIRLDNTEQSIYRIEDSLYECLDKYGKKK